MAAAALIGTIVYGYSLSNQDRLEGTPMAHIKKFFGGLASLFIAKSTIPTASYSEFHAAMSRATHASEECQQATQSRVAKILAARF